MRITIILLAVIVGINARFSILQKKPFVHRPISDVGDALILTPYLNEGRIEEARNDSEVHYSAFLDVLSYSGYFTVDEGNNGNLFFWFFPSADDYSTDPVILWLQGGPGTSSLYGLFDEHGPFVVDDDYNISPREYSWHKNHSILYIDQPAGTGYSFTGDLPYTETVVATHLYIALTQFFSMFPELQNNDFFVSGESYAGKFVPAISYEIHQRNQYEDFKINLQGILIASGWSDPINQFKYGDFLYQIGLIDVPTLDVIHNKEAEAVRYIEEEEYPTAAYVWYEIMNYITLQIGFDNVYNYLKDQDDASVAWQNFIVQEDVRQAIHVGSQDFLADNVLVYYSLYSDIAKSVAPWIVELLNHYRVLLFNGQLDIVGSYSLTANYLQNLNFSAADEYKTAERDIWYVGERVAGYVKTAGNLTEVLVRNAGHMVPADQPEFAHNLVYNFIRNTLNN